MLTLGKKILLLREKKNIKQSELATLVGITEATLSRYENDKRAPRGDILYKIAETLEVPLNFFYENETLKQSLSNDNLINKEIPKIELTPDIETTTKEILDLLNSSHSLNICGKRANEKDIEFLKEIYLKALSEIRIYSKIKR